MANAESAATPPPLPREFTVFAGVLSYLIPGLGQISQGRTGKGILFFVCIYSLFFYGMYLGTGTVRAAGVEYRVPGNVYLPDTIPPNADQRLANPLNLPLWAMNLYNRPQYAAQFWVGVVAWPAVIQYMGEDESAARDRVRELHAEARAAHESDKRDLADRLNAEADQLEQDLRSGNWQGNRIFGQFERAPTIEALNAFNTSRGKELELGWVYTVIAGVLNIMVIYDAMAGPAFPGGPKPVGPQGGA